MRQFRQISQMFQPGLGLKRWLAVVFLGLLSMALGSSTWLRMLLGRSEHPLVSLVMLRFLPRFYRGLLLFGSGTGLTLVGWRRLSRSIMRVMAPERPETDLAQLLLQRQRAVRGRRVVVIGGDPGLSPVLSALLSLKEDLRIDVILAATERGYLAQELRDKFGLSAPQVIFPFEEDAVLYAELEDGRLLEGAATINRYNGARVGDLFFSRDIRRVQVWESDQNGKGAASKLRDYMPSVSDAALDVISQAELIVFAPGRLYTQLLPNLTLPRLAQAIRESRATKVFVANLMTEPGKTDAWTVGDLLETIQKFTGVTMDYVIVHQGALSETILAQYHNEGSDVVHVTPEEGMSRLIFADTGEETTLLGGAVIVSGNFVTERPQIVSFQRGGDTILREMPVVRHDPNKLAPVFHQILETQIPVDHG